ncbi:hypothetical protein BDF19DRAFT_436961 [Syncephalis fuscata]|nr:hypothetical protein BDF19DRAFT_436961 [Syncephalis fuscata]
MDMIEDLGYHSDWRHNATRQWGIPLHPSGELYLYDYAALRDDRLSTQQLLLSIYFELSVDLMMSTLFAQNFFKAAVMIIRQPNFLSGWCCIIPAFLGAGWGVGVVLYLLGQTSCRPVVWFFVFATSISSISNNIIILQKAYIVLIKQKLILVIGALFMIPQMVFMFVFLSSSWVTTNVQGGCAIHYAPSIPYYWFALSIPINVLFSTLFSYVAYKQYTTFGTEAWKRLAREGIQTMCLVVICNIICATCLLLEVGGQFVDMFFVADWLITSTILVYHCSTARKNVVRQYQLGVAKIH